MESQAVFSSQNSRQIFFYLIATQACHSENAGDLSDEMRAAFGASFNADVAAAAEFEFRRKEEGASNEEETFTLAKHGWDMDFK